MSHPQQLDFVASVKNKYPHFFTSVQVLEIGSLDINGSVRPFFTDCDYTGIDLAEGPGVDVVAQGQDFDLPDKTFVTSISGECFEHNPYWSETFTNMHRLTSGILIFTCATEGRHEHGTARTTPSDSPFTQAWDYYRNLTEDDFDIFDLGMMFTKYKFSVNTESHDLYFYGLTR